MRKLTVVILIMILVLQSGIKTVIVSSFYINQDYIANVLCINKDNVAMKCNGKCYLTKRIKDQENTENKLASVLKEIKDVSGFLSSSSLISFIPTCFTFQKQNSIYSYKSYPSPLMDIYHPPC